MKKGQRVGRWEIISDEPMQGDGERKWLCRCQCGTQRGVLERSLRHETSLSCGCLRREKISGHVLTGKTFQDLTVLRKATNQRRNGGVWWTCRCSCGAECDVPGTLLVTGRKTHCGCKSRREKSFTDISGQKFHRLLALHPTDKRSRQGSVIWHCRCECGNELDVSYNDLLYTNLQSCGCQKKEHNQVLQEHLTHIAGTSLDILKSQKVPTNNTTGTKGVYFVRGKWLAKIVFQKKAYYLGYYDRQEDAVEARRDAEETINLGTIEHYNRWQARAAVDPEWAEANPIEIIVQKSMDKGLVIQFLPAI